MLGYTELRMSPTALQTTVSSHPMATMLSLVADVAGGVPQGLPKRWRSAVRSALPPYAGQVIGPLFHPSSPCFPDCLAASGALRTGTAEEQLDLIAATPPALLAEQLETDFGGTIPPPWRPVLRDPKRWLDQYVRTVRTLWTEFLPVWRQAGPLLDREAERVGVAAVRGALGVVLGSVSPRCRYEDGVLYVGDRQPAVFEQRERPLVLVPLVSGLSASVFSFDLPDVVWIGYPLPGLGRLWDGDPAPPSTADGVTLLLGAARAAILRYVETGATMSAVATAGGCSRATATYHCDKLETGGLVVRRRHGNEVWVRRTARGDALLELLDAP